MSNELEDTRSDNDEPTALRQDEADEALLRKLGKWERDARTHSSKWREEARQWYDLVSGEQWLEQDKVALLEQMRQPIVFNRTAPMVDAVVGAEILNRQETHFIPRQVGRVQVSEILTAANDWARQQSDAEDEESDAFSDSVICGMGWTETYMDYSEETAGLIMIGRTDPLEMGWDPTAKKRNITDRRYHFRRKGFERVELKAKFPKKYDQIVNVLDGRAQDEDDVGLDHRPPYDLYKDDDAGTGQRPSRLVYVTQYQWWELEDAYSIVDPSTGQQTALDPQKYAASVKLMLSHGMQPMKSAKVQRKVYYEAFVSNGVLLSKRTLPCGFTFQCITGKRDRNKNTWYGMVKAMCDPQRWANKWLSQILHIINTNAKGGLIYESGVFANPQKAIDEWSRPDSMVEVKSGALVSGKLQPKQAPQYPQGLDRLMTFALESMPQVTGINLEMLGLVQHEQAGVLEQQRKRAGYSILAVYFDALRRYRKLQGRVMLHYIQEYISDGRLIRVQHESGMEQYVPLVRQQGAIQYDVIVDDAPMSENQKDIVWGMLMQLMPVMKDAALPPQIWAEFVKYSPLPSALSTKISTAITQPDPKQQQMAEAHSQLELAGLQADVASKQAKANLDNARAHKEGSGADQQGATPQDYAAAQATMQDSEGQRMKDMSQTALNLAKAKRETAETAILPMRAMHEMALAQQESRQRNDIAVMKAKQRPASET